MLVDVRHNTLASVQHNKLVEAPTGIEPVMNGFADRRLADLATGPQV